VKDVLRKCSVEGCPIRINSPFVRCAWHDNEADEAQREEKQAHEQHRKEQSVRLYDEKIQ